MSIGQRDLDRFADRHPATRAALRWFDYGHLPEGLPRQVSTECAKLAIEMIEALDDGPELSAGLRKLREAKDCFVFEAVMEWQDKT